MWGILVSLYNLISIESFLLVRHAIPRVIYVTDHCEFRLVTLNTTDRVIKKTRMVDWGAEVVPTDPVYPS